MLWVVPRLAHTQVRIYGAMSDLKPRGANGEKLGAEWPTKKCSCVEQNRGGCYVRPSVLALQLTSDRALDKSFSLNIFLQLENQAKVKRLGLAHRVRVRSEEQINVTLLRLSQGWLTPCRGRVGADVPVRSGSAGKRPSLTSLRNTSPWTYLSTSDGSLGAGSCEWSGWRAANGPGLSQCAGQTDTASCTADVTWNFT